MKIKTIWDSWKRAQDQARLDHILSAYCYEAGYDEEADKYCISGNRRQRQEESFLRRIMDAFEYLDDYDAEWLDGGW